jgi:hypothetical protein
LTIVKLLNPKNFVNFKQQEKEIKNKSFFYIDRDLKDKEITYNDVTYKLEDPTNVDLTGQVTDPAHTISRSLFNSYEWSLLKASFCDAYLFCYLDFAPGSDSDAKQLKFRVYRLNKM